MKHLLILGAKSDIAKALAKEYARQGYHLILAGRQIEELSEFSNTLKSEYTIEVELVTFDVLDYESHELFINHLSVKPHGIICCVGYLGNQELATNDFNEASQIINTNYTGCVSILNHCATLLKESKEGFIIGVSSVAGERGRKSNYFYGSAKAGFTAYLSGLRARLLEHNIHVMTVKPGFVYTKMTAHLELPKLLTVTPEHVAKYVYKGQQQKKNVVYVKWMWRYIMWIIRSLPEFVFKKMNL